jgi:hypothetical protein
MDVATWTYGIAPIMTEKKLLVLASWTEASGMNDDQPSAAIFSSWDASVSGQ